MNSSQVDLHKLSQNLAERVEEIFEYFYLEMRKTPKCYLGQCPIHGGDNPTAFNLYHTGYKSKGNWRCNTHECHKVFHSSTFGFIRGVLSNRKYRWSTKADKQATIGETIKWCRDFLGDELETKNDKYIEEISLTKNINGLEQRKIKGSFNLDRDFYHRMITQPCEYFLNRRFQAETLEKFDVGLYNGDNPTMLNRAVVPLYDLAGHKVIACSGRSIFDKCPICKRYHNPEKICPPKGSLEGLKWRNSPNFPREDMLYPLYFSLPFIKKTGKIIIVESFVSVWRLYEAGFKNCVSVFGDNLTFSQKKLIDELGIESILVSRDNDAAGQNLVDSVTNLCEHTHKIKVLPVDYEDDIAECSIEKVKKIIEN